MTQSKIAIRNRKIKTTLEQAFGRGKARVHGNRGTACGWVKVKIDHTPMSGTVASELRDKCMQLLTVAGIDLGYYDSADYGSGYKISISFNQPRYRHHMTMSDGTICGQRWQDEQWEPYQA